MGKYYSNPQTFESAILEDGEVDQFLALGFRLTSELLEERADAITHLEDVVGHWQNHDPEYYKSELSVEIQETLRKIEKRVEAIFKRIWLGES